MFGKETMIVRSYPLLQYISPVKKFFLSTKGAKLIKINLHLIYQIIHNFCPQDGEIKKYES